MAEKMWISSGNNFRVWSRFPNWGLKLKSELQDPKGGLLQPYCTDVITPPLPSVHTVHHTSCCVFSRSHALYVQKILILPKFHFLNSNIEINKFSYHISLCLTLWHFLFSPSGCLGHRHPALHCAFYSADSRCHSARSLERCGVLSETTVGQAAGDQCKLSSAKRWT